MKNFWGCLLFLAFSANVLLAQQPEQYRYDGKMYLEAVELMNRGEFEAARKTFTDFLSHKAVDYSEEAINAAYYRAYCALKLFHKDAEFLMAAFVKKYPGSSWTEEAYLQLGYYNFSRRDYDDVLVWLGKIEIRDLDAAQKSEYYFKKGFSEFQLEKYSEAGKSFYQIKDQEGEYYAPANYYFGHIAYRNGNYQTALESFDRVKESEGFAEIVPYYITQIYYQQEKYDELLEYAPALLQSAETSEKENIARLIGDAYYKQQKYKEAVPYLEQYLAGSGPVSREDNYQIGYSYYRTGNYQKAVDYLSKAAKGDDKLAQIATYQLADAYVSLGQKKYAQNAFKVAAEYNFDPEIKEDALFHYAKLAYELSFDPFHEAIRAFQDYLEKYPASGKRDEAYGFLLKVYITTKDYKSALEALDKISTKDLITRKAYQISAYNYALELMQKGKEQEALQYFVKSKKYPEDPSLTALADYWSGDLYYRIGEYNKAINAYQAFLSGPSAYATKHYNDANYNIGYSYFRMTEYPRASEFFRKYVAAANTDPKKKNDSYLRIADAYFVAKDYPAAITNYRNAVNVKKLNADYALHQIARSQGYQDAYRKQIATLDELIESYPNSPFVVAGLYQKGDSYFSLGELEKALQAFNSVIENYPNSIYKKKSLLKKGLILYRQNDFDQAIATFKAVVKDYSSDEDTREAQATLKNIYIDLGRVDDYTAWLKSLPNYDISNSELDSISYQAAENAFSAGDCSKAIPALQKYLRQYANGIFATNAHFYLGECQYKQGNKEEALQAYNYVIAQPANSFSEPALLGAASLNYAAGNYEMALQNYINLEKVAQYKTNVLEAQIGQMRTNYKLNFLPEALNKAEDVINDQNTPKEILLEARTIRARVNQKQGNTNQAAEDFAWLVENSSGAPGAEAKFALAQMAFNKGNYKNAENLIFELVQKYPGQEKWKVEAFLLLSQVYTEMEDYFQARATLMSIKKNVSDQDVLQRANTLLDELDAREKAESGAEVQPTDTLPDQQDGENNEPIENNGK